MKCCLRFISGLTWLSCENNLLCSRISKFQRREIRNCRLSKAISYTVELCLFRSLSCCLKFAEHFSWQNRSDSWKKPLEIDSRRKVLFTTCAKTIDLLRKWIQKFPEQKPWRCANVCYKKDPKSYAIKRDPCNEMETENKGAAQVIRPGEMFMYWILNI